MLKVLKPGFFTTVQDIGRAGLLAFGVPRAGAVDEYACRTANIIAGNEETAPVLECTMLGGSYTFTEEVLIALTGADMAARYDDKPLRNWASHRLAPGGILELSYAVAGCRAYLAVAGGFALPEVLGSRSTHTRSHTGGLAGRALRAGDELLLNGAPPRREIALPPDLCPVAADPAIVRVLPGPQADAFTEDAFTALQSGEYTADASADRMGYRLSGAPLTHKEGADIISDALFAGAVQVPGNGQPIIMLADCQTTGGYTKLCFVISPDLPKVAQCRPGGRIKFVLIDEQEAVEALAARRERLDLARERARADAKRLDVLISGERYDVTIREVLR